MPAAAATYDVVAVKDKTARSCTIIVQSMNAEVLTELATKHEIINRAAKEGISSPGISNYSAPYPVNKDGVHNEDVMFGRNGQKAVAYRVDYSISGSI